MHLTPLDPAQFTKGEVAKQRHPDTWRERLEAGDLDFYLEVQVEREDERLGGSGEWYFYQGDLALVEGGWRAGRMEVEKVKRFYHYTSAASLASILGDGRIKMSQYGAAGKEVHFTSLPPTEFTKGQLATNNYGQVAHFGVIERTECWLEVEVDMEDTRMERCKIAVRADDEIFVYRGDMVRGFPIRISK